MVAHPVALAVGHPVVAQQAAERGEVELPAAESAGLPLQALEHQAASLDEVGTPSPETIRTRMPFLGTIPAIPM